MNTCLMILIGLTLSLRIMKLEVTCSSRHNEPVVTRTRTKGDGCNYHLQWNVLSACLSGPSQWESEAVTIVSEKVH